MALFDDVMAELPEQENPAEGGTSPEQKNPADSSAAAPKRGMDYSKEFIETYGERKK
jgi:hypothetical protein